MSKNLHDKATAWAREIALDPDLAAALRFALPDVLDVLVGRVKDLAEPEGVHEPLATRVACPFCGKDDNLSDFYYDTFGGKLTHENGVLYAYDRNGANGAGVLEAFCFSHCGHCHKSYELPWNAVEALNNHWDEEPPSVRAERAARKGR